MKLPPWLVMIGVVHNYSYKTRRGLIAEEGHEIQSKAAWPALTLEY